MCILIYMIHDVFCYRSFKYHEVPNIYSMFSHPQPLIQVSVGIHPQNTFCSLYPSLSSWIFSNRCSTSHQKLLKRVSCWLNFRGVSIVIRNAERRTVFRSGTFDPNRGMTPYRITMDHVPNRQVERPFTTIASFHEEDIEEIKRKR